MSWSRYACALAVTASVGCNTIAGINDPVDPPAGSSGSSGTSGGSSGGSSGGDPALERFVGTWRNVGQLRALCGNAPVETAPADLAAFELQITSSASGLVLTLVNFPGCSLASTVSGDVATFTAGQQCTFAVPGGTLQYSYSGSSTFTLTSATEAKMYIVADTQGSDGSTCAYEEGSLLEKQ